MADTEVEFHVEARAEYLEALTWYFQRSELVGRTFQSEVVRGIDLIEEQPLQWPIFDDGIRFLRLRRFPYVIYYEQTTENRIQVLALAHERRRPGYWRDRRAR